MARLFKDNVITELDDAGGIDDVTLVFDVTSGDEALFPVLGAGDFYYVTFSDFPLETVWEIFLIDTNPVGNTFTATSRGAVNGPAGNLVWSKGTLISMRVIATEYADFATGGGGGAANFDDILTDGMSVLVGAEGNVLTL